MLLRFGRSCPSLMQNRRSWKPPIPRGRKVISDFCRSRVPNGDLGDHDVGGVAPPHASPIATSGPRRPNPSFVRVARHTADVWLHASGTRPSRG